MAIELRHFRYFMAVAEMLHFGRAAKRLHISQPPLSQQIQRLEAELGVRLFDRSRHGVTLTDAGRHFLERAETVMVEVQRAIANAQQAGRGEVGLLRVGFTGSVPFTKMMPRLIRKFREAFPQVELRLNELSSIDQVDALLNGTLDIGFTRSLPALSMSQVDVWRVLSESLVVAMPAEHPLAAKKVITMRMLVDEPFVQYARSVSTGIHDQVISLCSAAGFAPKVAQEARHMPTIIGLVAAGVGIALVSPTMQQMQVPNIVYRPLRAVGAKTEGLLVCRRHEKSALIHNFVRLAKEGKHRDDHRAPRLSQ